MRHSSNAVAMACICGHGMRHCSPGSTWAFSKLRGICSHNEVVSRKVAKTKCGSTKPKSHSIKNEAFVLLSSALNKGSTTCTLAHWHPSAAETKSNPAKGGEIINTRKRAAVLCPSSDQPAGHQTSVDGQNTFHSQEHWPIWHRRVEGVLSFNAVSYP